MTMRCPILAILVAILTILRQKEKTLQTQVVYSSINWMLVDNPLMNGENIFNLKKDLFSLLPHLLLCPLRLFQIGERKNEIRIISDNSL